MGLEKAIASGKEHRKSFKDYNFAKYVDKQCRNHGNCEWCKGNRLYRRKKEIEKSNYEIQEFHKNIYRIPYTENEWGGDFVE